MTEYVVWNPSNGQTQEDGRHIDAHCARSAVEQWAQHDDAESADYTIVAGSPAEVMVSDCDGGEPERYSVSGESVPEYRARLLCNAVMSRP